MSDKLKAGEFVVMHSCGEAGFPENEGVIFEVSSNPRDLCGTEVVCIVSQDQSIRYPSFSTNYLQRVRISSPQQPQSEE